MELSSDLAYGLSSLIPKVLKFGDLRKIVCSSSLWERESRNRFSIDELRYLTEQLTKVEIVNSVNNDFVIEALRSISEIITYGDQHHDPDFFDFFKEKNVMGIFLRMLKVSRTRVSVRVSVQVLQSMSIILQNLKNEVSVHYMLSNEHMENLITYSYNFHNEELCSYYILFLRVISGRLDANTISLLAKTSDDDDEEERVISFPLFDEAVRFAFHEEGMIRIAARTLILNVYRIGDERVKRFVYGACHGDYFLKLVQYLRDLFIKLSKLIAESNPASIVSCVEEIEENLYYLNDAISAAGIPEVVNLITDSMFKVLINPWILPSLRFGTGSSFYLLCSILRVVKIKDIANGVAFSIALDSGSLRESLISFITHGDDIQASGSISLLTTLLQTDQEVDEWMLADLGILPQKKLILQTLVGEVSGQEQQLFGDENENGCEIHRRKECGASSRSQEVVDALLCLFGRTDVCGQTLWDAGWLLRQLLSYSDCECRHLEPVTSVSVNSCCKQKEPGLICSYHYFLMSGTSCEKKRTFCV